MWLRVKAVICCILVNQLPSNLVESEGNKGYCDFPRFLWAPYNSNPVVANIHLTKESRLNWYSKSEYLKNTQTLVREREIVALRTEFTVRIVLHEICEDYVHNTTFPCPKKRVKHSVLCLAKERDDKYRVQVLENEKSKFSCMKFVSRGPNIVQVYSAPISDENTDFLCVDDLFTREQWPWIIEKQQAWSFCPFHGGYTFQSLLNGEKKICKKEWNPAKVESECIKGEGIQFTFPKFRCSLFPEINRRDLQAYCWGSWTEDGYIFILMSVNNKRPQLVLRLPEGFDDEEEFDAAIYYSPIVPLRAKGQPSPDIYYVELSLKRNTTERGVVTRELTPSSKWECTFPGDYYGDWILYNNNHAEHLQITEGLVTFTDLGTYICKSKHWDKNHYKMVSVFSNGCRPRYTCFNFRRDGEALLYQMSKSVLSDESFEMCTFEDDNTLLGSAIRSDDHKVLLPSSSSLLSDCGLSGKMEIDALFPDGSVCVGTVSDWDFTACAATTTISLSLFPCSHAKFKDFKCLASAQLSNGISVLITDEKHDSQIVYKCWMIKSTEVQAGGLSHTFWTNAVLLDDGNCMISRQFDNIEKRRTPLITLTSKTNMEETFLYPIARPCYQEPPVGGSTTKLTVNGSVHNPSQNTPAIINLPAMPTAKPRSSETPSFFQNDGNGKFSGAMVYARDTTPPQSSQPVLVNPRNSGRAHDKSLRQSKDSPSSSSRVSFYIQAVKDYQPRCVFWVVAERVELSLWIFVSVVIVKLNVIFASSSLSAGFLQYSCDGLFDVHR